MTHRWLGTVIVLLALTACGREGPLVGGELVSPTPEATTTPPALTLAPTESPEATESPEPETPEPTEGTPGPTDDEFAGKAGIFGSVKAGPTCPVEQEGSPCPERPVADAEVTAKDEGGKVAGTARTDADGKFTMALAPGTYKVTASSPSVTSCEEQEAKVIDGHYTPVRIDCDTGIR